MTEEEAWNRYRGKGWRTMPTSASILILEKIRREHTRAVYLNALEYAIMTRKRPSRKLIALAVAEKLKGKT